VNNEAVGHDSPTLRLGRAHIGQRRALSGPRWVRAGMESAYDAASWICGLLAAAWMTRDLTGTPFTPFTLVRDIAVISLLSGTAGLLAGLYRGRYQRGSLDEVMAVGMATCVMALFLALVGPWLIAGQQAALQAVAGSAMFALLAMLGARYVLFAVRQRARRSAVATVSVIVFGAGDAGSTAAKSRGQPDAKRHSVRRIYRVESSVSTSGCGLCEPERLFAFACLVP